MTQSLCRVRIVNHVTDHASIIEFSRDQALVWFDLVRLVRCMNRRCDNGYRASVHLTPDLIVLHCHWPTRNRDQFSSAAIQVAGNLETLICDFINSGGPKA